MNLRRIEIPNLLRDCILASLGLALAYTVNFAQLAVPQFISNSVRAQHSTGTLKWEFNFASLPLGSYYLSGGRATGPCDLSIDGHVFVTTRAPFGALLQQLELGQSFTKTPQGPFTAQIQCHSQNGFSSGLTEQPVVLPYLEGRLLQLYRISVSVWLAFLAGLYLLLAVLTLAPPTLADSNRPLMAWSQTPFTEKIKNPFVIFAGVSTAYAASLSYGGWLLLPSQWATYLHILLRVALSYSFLRLGLSFTPRRRPYLQVYLALAVLFTVAMVTRADAFNLVRSYKAFHVVFGASTLLLWWDTKTLQKYGRINSLFSSIALMWAIAQISDTISLHLNCRRQLRP